VSAELRVVVSGSGKMGRQVLDALCADAATEPVGVVEKLTEGDALVLADGTSLPMSADPGELLTRLRPDVVVDFTNAEWTPVVADAALRAGTRIVIGTTGLDAAFKDDLQRRCEQAKLGAVVASNFAIGAVLMMQFARTAARYFDSAEIIELHHDQKVDAPSGTAKTTAELMIEARERPFAHNDPEKQVVPNTRGGELGGVAIHSVRLPGLVAHQEVILGGVGQTLTIRHDSTGRDSFMPGVLLAVKAVMELDHMVDGLDALLS
jgi:4-hydroxy-tetrahydrodipicolinate reductase